MECANADRNMKMCNCTYEPSRERQLLRCCITIARWESCRHVSSRQGEATYDRSIAHFVRLNS